MKLKVGDKVKIKTWKRMVIEFGWLPIFEDKTYIPCCLPFVSQMEDELNSLKTNRIVTIREIIGDYKYYHMLEIDFAWSDDMIEEKVLPKNENNFIDRFELMDI